MDMGVKSMTREPAKLAALGVLSVVMLLAIGRTITSVSGSAAAAPAAPPSPAAPAGSTTASTTAAAPTGGADPAGVAGAAMAAAHGAATDANAAQAPASALLTPRGQTIPGAATGGTTAGTTAGAAPGSTTPDEALVAANLAAAAGSTKVAVYFPLPPNQLRNPFMPSPEIEALVHPPVPVAPAGARPGTAAPQPNNTAPPVPVPSGPGRGAPSVGVQMAARPSGSMPPALAMAGDVAPRVNQAAAPPPAAVPAKAAVVAPPSPFHVALDTIDAAAESIKKQVTLKGVLVGNPSTAFATVGTAEQLLHPGDEMPGQAPGPVRFKVARISTDTISLEVDGRSISAISGNNIKIADAVAAIRVEIRQ